MNQMILMVFIFSVNALALERRYQKKEKKKQLEAGKGMLKGLIIIEMVSETDIFYDSL